MSINVMTENDPSLLAKKNLGNSFLCRIPVSVTLDLWAMGRQQSLKVTGLSNYKLHLSCETAKNTSFLYGVK
jgi:hypothetical protein